MNGQIRKISVGKDYPDGVLHYQINKRVKLNNNYYNISNILEQSRLENETKRTFDILITNDQGTILWKRISDVPVVIEYNIDFQ